MDIDAMNPDIPSRSRLVSVLYSRGRMLTGGSMNPLPEPNMTGKLGWGFERRWGRGNIFISFKLRGCKIQADYQQDETI